MLTLLALSLSFQRPTDQLIGAARLLKRTLVAGLRRLLRHAARLVLRCGYRVEARGLDRIPAEGGALLVSNHVSYLDAVVIYAACERPVRFVMDYRLYRLPLLHRFCRLMGVIPVAPRKHRPDVLAAAYRRIDEALQAGELVCLFPEGQITRHGNLNAFRPGVERMVSRTPVPVVPMALRGLWGSFFSRAGGPAGRGGRFGSAPSRIGLAVGTPVPARHVRASRLEQVVRRLRGRRR